MSNFSIIIKVILFFWHIIYTCSFPPSLQCFLRDRPLDSISLFSIFVIARHHRTYNIESTRKTRSWFIEIRRLIADLPIQQLNLPSGSNNPWALALALADLHAASHDHTRWRSSIRRVFSGIFTRHDTRLLGDSDARPERQNARTPERGSCRPQSRHSRPRLALWTWSRWAGTSSRLIKQLLRRMRRYD